MALRDIKRKITSVQKTQQITRAMKMVAAAKLRRAQEAIESARPYAEQMRRTLGALASQAVDVSVPLLQTREQRTKLEIIVVTSDRGLAGAFNANVLKHVDVLLVRASAKYEHIQLTLVGRKAAEYFAKRQPERIRARVQGVAAVDWSDAAALADGLAERYVSGEVDEVILVFNEFRSVMSQVVVEQPLLPFASDAAKEASELPYEVEPSANAVLAVLAPKALTTEFYRVLLENQAGEHAARMTAMESATRNTEELIEKLTLDYNRARQAAITAELIEIITGAQAL